MVYLPDYRQLPGELYHRINNGVRELPSYVYQGAAAGIGGAAVAAALMLVQQEMGWISRFDLIGALGQLTLTGRTGGWILHFIMGGLWGALFAWLDPDLPGDTLQQRGIAFGFGAWFVMMITLMPLVGYGFFALEIGVLATLFALLLHVVFGAAMGRLHAVLILQAVPLRFRMSRSR